MSERPNFLYIITDQHRADHLGSYGNKIVRTPNIDGIAARGLSFDKFYVASPLCMTNRATLVTGRMPTNTGVLTNGHPLPIEANTFIEALRGDGYKTALLGKSHLQNMHNMDIEDYNYPPKPGGRPLAEGLGDSWLIDRTGPEYQAERGDRWLADPDREIETPYYGFETVRFANSHGDKVNGHYTAWLRDRHPDPDSLKGPENALPAEGISAPLAWRTRVPEELWSTAYVEDITTNYLDEHAASGTDDPFFIQCSFPDPHHPFSPPGRYWDMYDPADCPLPASYNANHVDPPPFSEILRREFMDDKRNLRVAAYIANEEEIRTSIALTYGMITFVDDAVGRILAKLEALGLAENTVVVFNSDHGDMMGDHGLMLKHCYHYEGLIRVPFIWADPDTNDEGARTDILSGTLDIGRTILARAGLAPYHGMQGFDVVSAARSGEELPRLGMVLEEDELPFNGNCPQFTRTRTFVTGRWRLTYWLEDQFGELYDRDEDPEEINNLWNDPGAAANKAEMLELMMRERIALEDMAPRAIYNA
jgi:arylsulfatase A-like enzyme